MLRDVSGTTDGLRMSGTALVASLEAITDELATLRMDCVTNGLGSVCDDIDSTQLQTGANFTQVKMTPFIWMCRSQQGMLLCCTFHLLLPYLLLI